MSTRCSIMYHKRDTIHIYYDWADNKFHFDLHGSTTRISLPELLELREQLSSWLESEENQDKLERAREEEENYDE